MEINVIANDIPVARLVSQTKFATAKTLTKLAKISQKHIQNKIPQTFDTTRKWWKNRGAGILVKSATKGRLMSQVYTGRHNTWLHRHEYGEKRRSAGRGLIIPMYKKSGDSPIKNDPAFRGFKAATWKKSAGLTQAMDKYGKNRKVKGKYPVIIRVDKPRGEVWGIKRGKKKPMQWIFSHRKYTKAMKKKPIMLNQTKFVVEHFSKSVFRHELIQAFRTMRLP